MSTKFVAKTTIRNIQAGLSAQRARTTKMHKALPNVRALLTKCEALPSMADLVSWSPSLSESYYHDADACIQFYLEKRDSTLVRDLVRLTGKPARKSKSGESISALILFDGLRITVEGYKPETCVLVPELVEVPVKLEGITCKYCGASPTDAGLRCTTRVTMDGQDTHEWIKIDIRNKIVCTPSEKVEV